MGEHEAEEAPCKFPDEAFAPQEHIGTDPFEDAEVNVPQDTVVLQ